MPVLAPITVVSLLLGGTDEKVSLLSPESLRPPLASVLAGDAPELRATAMEFLVRLESSVADYNETVVSVMDAYAEEMER